MTKLVFTIDDLVTGCNLLKSKAKFTPGFDKMTADAAETWLKVNGEQLCKSLNSGKYRVMPATGFNVAKPNGQYRKLAKLTAIDTIVQNVSLEKLEGECTGKFSEYSFAYQKGKGTGAALRKFCEYASRYPYAAKIDPKSCFDSIDFSLLEKSLNSFFNNRKTVNLLMLFAKMPVITEGQLTDRHKGILQGAPASGMLCNIFLHALDTELEKQELPFLRYADDIVVFAETKNEAEKANDFVCNHLENNLRLKVNKAKGCVDASEKLTYLGRKFIRNKDGMVVIGQGGKNVAVYYEWNRSRPANHRNSVDILSDGILRQKDYSAIFESETDKSVLPLDTVERINVFSSVIFDSGFLERAMNAGVAINVFSRDYTFKGRFTPSCAIKDQRVIFEQLEAYNNENERLKLAKEFDLASVHNLRLNIRYYNKQGELDSYKRALELIDGLYTKMKECKKYNDLLLIEAQTRGLYYSCFDSFISNKAFSFGTRSKQPPLNEVNSMISFGNVVLYNYIATEIHKSSLDVRVGFLHATNRREESLNLDIAEIFRPLIVDRVVFTLINRKEIMLSCFNTESNGGVYLNEEGKRIFLRNFYEKMNSTLLINGKYYSYAMLIDEEIKKLTRQFRSGEKYKAFRQVR